MDITIIIAFLALYYIMGLGAVIAFRETGMEEVRLEKRDYLAAAMFPLMLLVAFTGWIVEKIVR
jgi:hypothetical protein